MLKSLTCALALFACSAQTGFAEDNPELNLLEGHWKVTELVEDGKVIPPAAIQEWLPSGGKVEIASNAIIFTSPADGKKHVKIFSVAPAEYPKQIDVSTKESKDGWGIYQFENERLIICISDPETEKRPTDFSAKEGSKRMRLVLERNDKQKAPAATVKIKPVPEPGNTAKLLSDAEDTKLLIGGWQYNDSIGALFVTLSSDGTFSTVRQVQQIRLFQKVFVQTPVSTGTWKVVDGKLRFHVLTSTRIDRVNKAFDFHLRSVSKNDFIFVDYLGITGRATKLP